METKKCTKCMKEKHISEFHDDKRKKDGLKYHCKECVREWRRIYMKKYRRLPHVVEKIKEYNENPNVIKARKEYSYKYNRLPENMEKERFRMRERSKCKEFAKKRKEYIEEYISRPDVKKRINDRMRVYKRKYTKLPRVKEKTNEYLSNIRNKISSIYVKQLLYSQSKKLLKFNEIPTHLIEAKRENIKLKRLIKSKKDD